MKLAPIRSDFFNRHNINFTSKVVEVGLGHVPKDIKDAVDDFEEKNRANARRLGDGLHAIAYHIYGTNCVIKESKPGASEILNGDFSEEAKSLAKIPECFQHAQKLIGNVKTEAGNWYLLSTLVDGKVADGAVIKETVNGKSRIKEVHPKWSRKSLRSLMDSLAQLDGLRFYHGDVSKNNCLVTKNEEVNLLDFQYAKDFEIIGDEAHKKNAEMYKVPYFIAPSNLQMFEESCFGTYLAENITKKEAKELYQEFLEEKSIYHKKRAVEFEKQGARAEIVEYDTLMAKYLKNPPEGLKNLSIQKLQMMMEHRGVLSAMDGFDNFMSFVSQYLKTIKKAGEMAVSAREYAQKEKDPQLRKLYEYFEKDAEFWRSTMRTELDGRYGKPSAFEWILRNAQMKPINQGDDASALFKKSDDKGLLVVPSVEDTLLNKKKSATVKVAEDELISAMDNAMAELRKTQSYYANKKSKAYELIQGHYAKKDEILQDLKKARELYLSENQDYSIFHTLKALRQTAILRKDAYKLTFNKALTTEEQQQLREETLFLDGFVKEVSGLNQNLYDKLYDKASRLPVDKE